MKEINLIIRADSTRQSNFFSVIKDLFMRIFVNTGEVKNAQNPTLFFGLSRYAQIF